MYFSSFQKLDISTKSLFDSFCNEEWIAESGFTSIFMWDNVIHSHYTILNDILCIFCEPENESPFVILLSKNFSIKNLKSTIDWLFDLFLKNDIRLKLGYVLPSLMPLLESLLSYNYEVTYNRKDSDYIYEENDFISIEGKKHKSRRYDINHLIRHYKIDIDNITSDNINECLSFMNKINCSCKLCSECIYGCEKDALQLLLEHFNALNCKGIIIKLNGETAAYAIGEQLSNNLFAYHFLKLDKSIRGLSAFLQREFSFRFHSCVKYINYSEDMALAGLKQYKSKLCPVMIAHKFFVTISSLIYK